MFPIVPVNSKLNPVINSTSRNDKPPLAMRSLSRPSILPKINSKESIGIKPKHAFSKFKVLSKVSLFANKMKNSKRKINKVAIQKGKPEQIDSFSILKGVQV
jgi:hypothetical protein